jgi:rubrerythrin
MGLYNRNLERGVYQKRCEELKEHFQKVLHSDNVEVDFFLKDYRHYNVVYYKVKKEDKVVISERYNYLKRVKELHRKRKEHNKVLEINKIRRFEEVKQKYILNGITDVKFDVASINGKITYVCQVCGYEGQTNLSSAYVGKCRCKMCWLKNKRK